MNLFSRVARAFTGRGPRQVESSAPIRGRYEAAQQSNEIKNLWALADVLDADASNSLAVRTMLRKRSRHERANNGHYAGIIKTQANYVIGTGPRLRMQTGSPGMNAMVEAAWERWCKETHFFRKLRCMDRAKTADGEAVALLVTRPNLPPNEVAIDVRLVECDQLTQPTGVAWNRPNYVDGVTFDEAGNPVSYDILDQHPGGLWAAGVTQNYKTYPAAFVCHWFGGDERPGQHRGVPETTPTLNLYGMGRRYREAVVAAAETAADFAAMLEMPATNEGPDEVSPFSSLPIEKRMLVATPAGGKLAQMRAEQPSASYDSFTRSMVSEEARPLGMSYSIAAADSTGNSFSGTQNDHLIYYRGVDVERQDCELLILEKVFAAWFSIAVDTYRWTFDAEPAPRHSWNWPATPSVDQEKTANARKTALADGTTSLGRIYAEDGLDFEDEIVAMAVEYGVTIEEMRAKLFEVNFQKAGAAPAAQPPDSTPDNSGDAKPPAKAGAPANRFNGHRHLIHGDLA